jgi:hypothetical protein
VSWSRHPGVRVKLAADQEGLHKITNPQHLQFQPVEYAKYLWDAVRNKIYHFSMELWLSGLHTFESGDNAYAAGLPDASGVRCPHFDVESFVANKQERRLLNNFRTQCTYCQELRASKRSREICEEACGL